MTNDVTERDKGCTILEFVRCTVCSPLRSITLDVSFQCRQCLILHIYDINKLPINSYMYCTSFLANVIIFPYTIVKKSSTFHSLNSSNARHRPYDAFRLITSARQCYSKTPRETRSGQSVYLLAVGSGFEIEHFTR